MPSASDDIAAAIAAADGALRFDRFVELALYGPHGFYTGTGRAGRRGDFITSAEVGPLFGTVLARWIDAEHRRVGSPDDFTVVEVGAGPGALARAITAEWAARPAPPSFRYVAVERSGAQRALHPASVTSQADLPIQPFTGVIVANELLDNLAFRLLVWDGAWREAFVAEHAGRFVEVLHPLAEVPPFLPARAPLGARVPWQQQARDWVAGAQQLLTAGSVLAIDYVTPMTAQLAVMPWREWLRTYRGHERGVHYLTDAGEQDITTQVALDQLPEPLSVRTQAQFLQLYDIDDLVEAGRVFWQAAAAAPTVAAMRMRSRVREAEALLDPAGLGGFLCLLFPATG
ncbi:MAG: SAM-dependent methyltransferase [Ilumatobacteraceae bacterium]